MAFEILSSNIFADGWCYVLLKLPPATPSKRTRDAFLQVEIVNPLLELQSPTLFPELKDSVCGTPVSQDW